MEASFPSSLNKNVRSFLLLFSLILAVLLLVTVFSIIQSGTPTAWAAPIQPPAGFPKLTQSTMVVSPTLAHTGGSTLEYHIRIQNTGAYAAQGTKLVNVLPARMTYNGGAHASPGPDPTVANGVLEWSGDVGFDSSVDIWFRLQADPTLSGTITNTAVISQPLITAPVVLKADAVITNDPILKISKSAEPEKPGANKPVVYTLVVENQGQPALNLPITVTDRIPANTTFLNAGQGGTANGGIVRWNNIVNLDLGETAAYTFSVNVGSVPSGTVITNDQYQVSSPLSGVSSGKPYTNTIVSPIFSISKSVFPDPPGSNREMTYTLTVLNQGSLATGLQVNDQIPAGVTYVHGGTRTGNTVRWTLDHLDTGEVAKFSYTVSVGDVQGVQVINQVYSVCSSEGVCLSGQPLVSQVMGPSFEVSASLNPIAKKPGGGGGGEGGTVTPTLVLRNLGPGNAIDAHVRLEFTNISVSRNDLRAIPDPGIPPYFPVGPACGENCSSYLWTGNLGVGQVITFTTNGGQTTIGGNEGDTYTATLIVTDTLGITSTAPMTATAVGRITHFSHLIPEKSAPEVVGRGQLMTYDIQVRNSGLSTELPNPVLTETVPMSVSLVSISDGGISGTVDGSTVISWTLPAMSPGDILQRTFTVQVDHDLVSGTEIINSQYGTGYTSNATYTTTAGIPVTTTVQDAGLIDSFKEVTPTLALPGPDNYLTYYVHVINSSNVPLSGVHLYDYLPWEHTTYQRDAVASAGEVISDIVSVEWSGDVAPFSSEVITLSVLVDPGFEGTITNTAVITHPELLKEVNISAVAYITTKPVLLISKTASKDEVWPGDELVYTIRVVNKGQQATGLVITDTLPENTEYVLNSISSGGSVIDGLARWTIPVLKAGEEREFTFRVVVQGGDVIINEAYGVVCTEGIWAAGQPVVTPVKGYMVYLPIMNRKP